MIVKNTVLFRKKNPSVLETKHHGEEEALGRPHCGPVPEDGLLKSRKKNFVCRQIVAGQWEMVLN